ncbi:Hint domain-containing protein, partial [Streptomyces sp. NPDC091263]|uniref:Hint domain-containing protein n=1 Tax=Streptomyces sp. NPDC091263 TaxID=3155194 RepID=UPI00344F1FF6
KSRKKVKEAEEALEKAGKKVDGEKKSPPKKDDKPDENPNCKVKHSFPPGTRVLLADGRKVSIETVRAGDRVEATDPDSGLTQARRVERPITTKDDKDFTRLTFRTAAGPAVITATDTHPFWITGQRRWTDAGDITPGMKLRTPDGSVLAVAAVSRYTQHRTTHDLTVNGIHTYYVLAGGVPVLVHNNSWCTDEERIEDAEDIANGHADGKHAGDFPGVSKKELGDLTKDVMQNPSRTKDLGSGRKAYLGKDGTTIVIHDPMSPDGGTVFRRDPAKLDKYWEELN